MAADELHQLPPAGELWGWAHVQSSVPVEEVVATIESDPAALRSRIICPRRLEPGRTYRAALVNAFAAGAGEASEPAWSDSGKLVELLVYDTWTFTTAAEAGDFESLCDLLAPAPEAGRIGVREVDVTAPGLEVDWPRTPMIVELVGALADPGEVTDAAPPGTKPFITAVKPILEDVLDRADDDTTGKDYDALRDDPVVGLPFHGSWPAHATTVPGTGWARELNLRTNRRMAAGLGARTVRHNQEELMAAAWDQLGSIREASDELNRARLGAEVARSRQAGVAAVEPGDRLVLAAPLLTFVTVRGEPARKLISAGAAPTGLIERAWLRRPPRGRGASAGTAFVEATRAGAAPELRRALDFRKVAPAEGMSPAEIELAVEEDPGDLIGAEAMAHVAATGLAQTVGGTKLAGFVLGSAPIGGRSPKKPGARPGPTKPRTGTAKPLRRTPAGGRDAPPGGIPKDTPGIPPGIPTTTKATAADVADAVAALDPLVAARASIVARIPALAKLLPADEMPASFALAPEFEDPLFWDLAEIDEDVIVPGIGDFPVNRVRLLAVDPGFVGAYLLGAQHELAREFLWREYPTDLTATFFTRFFDYGDAETVDILPIAGWDEESSISDNLPGAATTTAILIRGDLVRRYPDANIFLAPPGTGGVPAYDDGIQPSFEGRLGTDVLVVGFPVKTDVVLGKNGVGEHFVVIEERVTAPRFGLDLARSGALKTWDGLAWTDFEGSGDHISTGPIPRLGPTVIGPVEWGRNSAHLGAAVHQRPYRRVYPATHLVVEP